MAKKKSGAAKAKGSNNQQAPVMRTRALGMDITAGGRTVISRRSGPQVTPVKGGLRIRNTERLNSLNVVATGTEYRVGYLFNPGSVVNYPWLANIANNYSMYRVHKLEFSYIPFVGTTVSGEVALGIVYDAEEVVNWASAGSLANLAQLSEFCSGPPYSGGAMSSAESKVAAYHGVGADTTAGHRKAPWLLVDPSPGNQAERNQSCGFGLLLGYISTATGTNGTLYVSYDIEFIKPTAPGIQ